MSDDTDAILYRRPDPQIGRPDLRWLEVRARGTIADLGGWWEQVNPAWIERHLDPGTCRATEPSGIDPALHRVTCCRNHAEVDLRIEEIADLLLLYPFLPEGDRARRYRLVDALYSDLFLAWLGGFFFPWKRVARRHSPKVQFHQNTTGAVPVPRLRKR